MLEIKMNKTIIISTGLIAALCVFWFIHSPGYDSLVCFISSISILIIELVVPLWRKYIGQNIYTIHVRAIDEKEFMTYLKGIFNEIKRYRVTKIDGEFSNIIINTRRPINHKELYDISHEKIREYQGKIYSVVGKRKAYGIIMDTMPAQYFKPK
jgi:hypothetical protein